jgi:hypothetical protein
LSAVAHGAKEEVIQGPQPFSFVVLACAGTTAGCESTFSRHHLSEVCKFVRPKNRGRREDRVRAAPAVSCARVANKNAHEHTGSAEAVRPSLRNGVTAYFVLSPVRPGLFVTVTPRKRELPKNLTPAMGRQDHTILPSAPAALVSRSFRVHRPPRPTSVTFAKRPLWVRDGRK